MIKNKQKWMIYEILCDHRPRKQLFV